MASVYKTRLIGIREQAFVPRSHGEYHSHAHTLLIPMSELQLLLLHSDDFSVNPYSVPRNPKGWFRRLLPIFDLSLSHVTYFFRATESQ